MSTSDTAPGAAPAQAAPLVSIVVPVHNQERHLAASLESCLAQSHPRLEVLVVDDQSSDRSCEVARRYEPAVRLIRPARRLGSCGARNVGLSQAAGEFILFHDGDDVLFPECLRSNLAAGAAGADVVISANRWFRDGARVPSTPRARCRRERRLLGRLAQVGGRREESLKHVLRYGGLQHSCALYRTAVARALGGYADGSEPYADRELLFRALCGRARVSLNMGVTSGWRVYRSPDRMTWRLRGDDDQRRLALAERYHASLEAAGLLEDDSLRRALIEHVARQVYAYAVRRARREAVAAALALIARLSRRPAKGATRGAEVSAA